MSCVIANNQCNTSPSSIENVNTTTGSMGYHSGLPKRLGKSNVGKGSRYLIRN
jgi:hypothetical protein